MEKTQSKIIMSRSGEWINQAAKLYTLQMNIKRLKEEEKELSEELIKLSEEQDSKGGNELLGGFEFKKISRVGAVKYSEIPELKNVDLNPYRGNPVSFWQLYRKY